MIPWIGEHEKQETYSSKIPCIDINCDLRNRRKKAF